LLGFLRCVIIRCNELAGSVIRCKQVFARRGERLGDKPFQRPTRSAQTSCKKGDSVAYAQRSPSLVPHREDRREVRRSRPWGPGKHARQGRANQSSDGIGTD
jgi:hypothetical protein